MGTPADRANMSSGSCWCCAITNATATVVMIVVLKEVIALPLQLSSSDLQARGNRRNNEAV